ncbi:hypothetical protein Cgig2_004348 [Carnegiea gigantea]|uniref:Uncharacterized protein n=1 Tax=Carnegiea gigantea TaxID=171969 RepID=A0A9Q1JZE3_9CARY|nr:hypothetical protein Cgig2_004348 [Carnegiea gigantea]
MGFPRLLKMDGMALYLLENFEWYRREVAFPPLPLPSNYEDLCPDFNLTVGRFTQMDDWHNGVGPQGVTGENLYCFLHHGFPDVLSTEQAADYVRETFKWHLRGATRPPRPFPTNYHELYTHFDLTAAEEALHDFCITKMVQAIFYTMVVNEAFELGVLSRDLAEHLKLCIEGLQWYMCKGLCVSSTSPLTPSSTFLSSRRNILKRSTGPQREHHHPQFLSLPALIDDRVVARIPTKNQFREPKKGPYPMQICEPDTPS